MRNLPSIKWSNTFHLATTHLHISHAHICLRVVNCSYGHNRCIVSFRMSSASATNPEIYPFAYLLDFSHQSWTNTTVKLPNLRKWPGFDRTSSMWRWYLPPPNMLGSHSLDLKHLVWTRDSPLKLLWSWSELVITTWAEISHHLHRLPSMNCHNFKHFTYG